MPLTMTRFDTDENLAIRDSHYRLRVKGGP